MSILPGTSFDDLIAQLIAQYQPRMSQGGMMPNVVNQPPAMPAQPSFEQYGRQGGMTPAMMAQQIQGSQPGGGGGGGMGPPTNLLAGSQMMQPQTPDLLEQMRQMQQAWMMRNANNRFLPGGGGMFGGGMGDMI